MNDSFDLWIKQMVTSFASQNGIKKREAIDRLIKKLKKIKG